MLLVQASALIGGNEFVRQLKNDQRDSRSVGRSHLVSHPASIAGLGRLQPPAYCTVVISPFLLSPLIFRLRQVELGVEVVTPGSVAL